MTGSHSTSIPIRSKAVKPRRGRVSQEIRRELYGLDRGIIATPTGRKAGTGRPRTGKVRLTGIGSWQGVRGAASPARRPGPCGGRESGRVDVAQGHARGFADFG